jgi:cyclohexadieny/prephenate dehydrogenase
MGENSGTVTSGERMFKRMALIGVGLIGSSISHAARRAGLVGEIVGFSSTAETRDKAEALGLVTKAYADPADAVRGADLVILCTPVGAYGKIAEAIGPHLQKGAIVSDVGSVKAAAVRDIAPHIPVGVHFIAGHPVAGTEQSGPEAGFAELFDGRWCILTPEEDADSAALAKLETFWHRLGSHVEIMTPEHHDLVLAITSHIPHLIAYNIVNTAAHLGRVTDSEVIKFSAGGFRDFTRIAASDPVMWRDVFLNNKEAVLEMLGRFSEDLVSLQRAIRFSDAATLEKLFAEARAIRRGIIQAGQDTPQPDFGRRTERVAPSES